MYTYQTKYGEIRWIKNVLFIDSYVHLQFARKTIGSYVMLYRRSSCHLCERCVLRVESVKLRLLLHDQSPELLLLRLPLLGVGLQQVAGADSLDLLLLHLLGHRVEYHNETVRDFLNMFMLLYHDTLKHHTRLLLYLEVSNVTEEILAHLLEFLSLGRGILVEHSDPVEVVKVEASLVQSLGRHVVTSAASLHHLFQINLTVDTRWLG